MEQPHHSGANGATPPDGLNGRAAASEHSVGTTETQGAPQFIHKTVGRSSSRPYTCIANDLITDPRLTDPGFRLFSYLLSKPVDWAISVADCKKVLGWGDKKFANALENLHARCLMWTHRDRREDGTLGTFVRHVTDDPKLNPHYRGGQPLCPEGVVVKKPRKIKGPPLCPQPLVDEPLVDEPLAAEEGVTKKERTKKERTKKERTKKERTKKDPPLARAITIAPAPANTPPDICLSDENLKKIRSTLETKLGDTEIRRAWRKHLIHWQMPKGGRRRQLYGGTVDDITTENFFLSFIDWIDRDSKQAEEKAAAQSASVDAKNPVLQKLLAHVEAKPDPIDKHIDWPKVYHAGGRSRFACMSGQPGFDKVVQFVRTERNNARGEKQEREIKKIFATKTLDEWQQIIPNDVGLGNQVSRNKYREHVKSVLEDGLKKQERMAAYARWYPDSKPENVPAPKTFFDWQTWVLTKADYDKLENIIEDIFGCSMRPVNMMGADGERKGSEEAKRLRCYLHEIATDYDAGKLTPARLADYYQATFFYFDRDDECTGDNAGMNVSFYNQLYENERKLKDVSQQNRGSDGITDWMGNLSSAGQVAHEPT